MVNLIFTLLLHHSDPSHVVNYDHVSLPVQTVFLFLLDIRISLFCLLIFLHTLKRSILNTQRNIITQHIVQSHKHVEQQNPDAKEYVLNDAIYIKFENSGRIWLMKGVTGKASKVL